MFLSIECNESFSAGQTVTMSMSKGFSEQLNMDNEDHVRGLQTKKKLAVEREILLGCIITIETFFIT